ncbi:hypothetical protein [Kineosporia sp. NBRC 101731]|uniref:hypothetical protein n=1 Tax=Kineosporia sp. NBRC 101731 TaxID=3032199 RepID=UPI00249FD4A8|nr:hypothetical protein [Kineosporia sp. NBRC 101731]GLY28260.1 hypothetical protein Kisp02_16250 [Kineosporia sp. NBRC 101731]
MSLSPEEATHQLYAVEPGLFTAERTRLAAAARTNGDTVAAKSIGGLRRPTTSAWLVNQLARGEQGSGDDMERLDHLGRELRAAQAALDAPRMRELTKERHQLIAALVRHAEHVAGGAGQKVSVAVRRELEDTLGAAVADEQAARAVMSGRLTRALTYAGFGEVDITEATATPLSVVLPYRARDSDTGGTKEAAGRPGGMRRSDTKLRDPEHDSGGGDRKSTSPDQRPAARKEPRGHVEQRVEQQTARRARAEGLVATTRAEVAEAEAEMQQKEQELAELTSEQADLQARLDELQAEVVAVRRRLDAGDRRTSQVGREVKRQERRLKDAGKALERAQAALDRHEPS